MRWLFNRIKYIYQDEGLSSLIKRTFKFLISLPFEYSQFHIYITELGEEEENESEWIPRVNNYSYRNIFTNEQLNGLIRDGFDLSLLNVSQARNRLEKGAIVSLFFVDRELAFYGWLAFSEEAKNSFNNYSYKVNFENGEASSGDNWTNPKYRRKGILFYSGYKRRQLLIEKDRKKIRWITLAGNEAMHKEIIKENKLGIYKSKICATARFIRVFNITFWNEKPIG